MNRVVILVENLPVPLDRRVWQEATALRDAGWLVSVIGPRGPGSMRRLREQLDGIEILRYPQVPASGLRGYITEYLPSLLFTWAWLTWLRLRGPIAVIHGCNPPDLFWMFGLLARLWRAKYVFDQHDANPELALTKFADGGLKTRVLVLITKWLEKASYRTATLVVTPNDTYADLARTRGRVPDDKIIVVRNGPDVTAYREFAAGVVPNPLKVGYVGVMGSQDGLDLLIDAWARVTEEDDLRGAVLELVGDGESRRDLERQVDRLGLNRNVVFRGYAKPSRFVPILAECAVCVSPDPPTPFNVVSTMVKVVDYLAIGRAVVMFDLAETRSLAGDAARIVRDPTPARLAEALIHLLRSPDEAARLGAAAVIQADALRLDWAYSAKRLVAAYCRFRDAQ